MKKNIVEKILKKIGYDLANEKKSLAAKETELIRLKLELQYSLGSLEKEKKLVSDYPNIYGFGEFLELEQKKQTIIKNHIAQVQAVIDITRDQLCDILAEQKKYEHLLKKIELEEHKKQEKIEREVLDNFKTQAAILW